MLYIGEREGFRFIFWQSNLVILQIKARWFQYSSFPYTCVTVTNGTEHSTWNSDHLG
jgi:hypothetical protein